MSQLQKTVCTCVVCLLQWGTASIQQEKKEFQCSPKQTIHSHHLFSGGVGTFHGVRTSVGGVDFGPNLAGWWVGLHLLGRAEQRLERSTSLPLNDVTIAISDSLVYHIWAIPTRTETHTPLLAG